jgi:hypothetical protein
MTTTATQLLVPLLAAHVLGDFLLQPRGLARAKHRLPHLLAHTLVVTAITYALCGRWLDWRLPVAVFALHTLVDAMKAHLLPRNLAAFLADQAAHVAGLAAIAAWLGGSSAEPFWGSLLGEVFYDGAVLVAGLVLATRGAGFAVGLGVQPFLDELEAQGRDEADRVAPLARGFQSGGQTIGYLERGLILLLVLVGQGQGVGFLLAAKSILRFGELKDPRHRMEAEYIIIGTLASFVAGLAVAFAVQWVLALTVHV